MRLVLVAIGLAVVLAVPFLIWGDAFDAAFSFERRDVLHGASEGARIVLAALGSAVLSDARRRPHGHGLAFRIPRFADELVT